MKTDARTQYTKKVIRECFFSLLKEQPLNKITVKSICERAQINRTTFYRYYSDPFDLMDQIEADLFATIQRYIGMLSGRTPEEAIETVLDITIKNEEFHTILASDSTNYPYINRMIESSYESFQNGFARLHPDLSLKQRKWLYSYMAHGCISVVLDWVDGGMRETPREVAHFVTQLDEILLKDLAL